MENLELAVGTPECSIHIIVSVIRNDEKVINNWTSLARRLEIPNAEIKKLQQNLWLNLINYSDLFYDVLEQWVGMKGKDAKLIIFILAVEEECNAVNVGESIRRLFNLPTSSVCDGISWDTLPKALQAKAANNLHKLIPNMPIEDIKNNLNGILLRQLIKDVPQTLPESLSYYVNRTVRSRNIISTNIFVNCPTHVFLISGIERYELSRFAKDKTTDSSSNQIKQGKLTVQHIKLDFPYHFNKICEMTCDPVHWFSFQGNKLKWIHSREGISAVQTFVDKPQSQDILIENDFLASLQLDDSNQPKCISDSPGMGKSVFLAEIGRKLVDQYPDRAVIFLVLAEVIKTMKEIDINGLLDSISQNFNNNGISIELLLDGFDEVDFSEREFAFELLRKIRTCEAIRIWVTSRPHWLEELERTLETIGFNIQPFSVDDQVRFLTSYWLAMHTSIKNKDKLTRFANHSLETLNFTLNSDDIDIAGVPLQCLLIAEVYGEEASAFSNSEQSTFPAPLSTSITELYQSLIDRKFQKSGWTQSETMMDMHARLGVELLFPEQFEKLKHLFGPVDMEEILKIGILQSSSMSSVPRFLHRTFAEYFVAWFVWNSMKNDIVDEHFVEFFTNHVINCNPSNADSIRRRSIFTQDVITYFLNSLMEKFPAIRFPFPGHTMKFLYSDEYIRTIAWTCVGTNRLQIFKLVMELDVSNMLKEKILAEQMLYRSVLFSSLEFVKAVLERFEEHHNFNENVQSKCLETAVIRGEFSIVEFLIKERQLQRMLKKQNIRNELLLHHCVRDSLSNSPCQIDEKLQIIRMLADINPSLLDMRNRWGYTPILSRYAHIRLQIELIHLGANVLNVTYDSTTLLHDADHKYEYYSKLCTITDYHSLVLSIPEEALKKLVKIKGGFYKHTPLLSILHNFDPVPATLDLFKKVGADFNCVGENEKGYSLLALALIWGRNEATIRKLIECGADVHWRRGWRRKTLLHLAAANNWVLPESLAVLLEWIDAKVMDLRRETPMDYARKKGAYYVQRLERGLSWQEKVDEPTPTTS